MKTAFMVPLLAIVSLSAVVIGAVESSSQVQNRGMLASAAAHAKSRGETSARIPAPGGILWAGDASVDDALDHFSVVIARPVDSDAAPQGADNIVTWFRFQIVDNLWDKGRKAPHRIKPPSIVSTKRTDSEFFVPVTGGTAIIDGVKVTQDFVYPPFQIGQTYLLVARIDDQQVALLNYGPNLIMKVDDSGRFSPISSRYHPSRQSFFNRIGNSRGVAKRNLAAMKKQ
jgi:hypothetical protein